MPKQSIKAGNRAGQISLDYMMGALIFMLVIMFLGLGTLSLLPSYFEDIGENALNEKAWIVSERVLMNITKNGWIDKTPLMQLESCTSSLAEYNKLRTYFGAGENNNFRLTITQYPIAFTQTNMSSDPHPNYTGTITINGSALNLITLYNTSSSDNYDLVNISNSTTTYLLNDTCIYDCEKGLYDCSICYFDVNGTSYAVRHIDYDGQFVILASRFIDCGISSEYYTNAVVKRYGVFEGFITEVKVTYW